MNELAQSSLALRQSKLQTQEDALGIKLSLLLNPFAQRADIQEQLQLYLPLQGSYTPDGKTLVAMAKTIHLWDAVSGEPLLTLDWDEYRVICVEYSPDGKILATLGARDKTVRLWSAETGECLQVNTLPEAAHSISWQQVNGQDRIVIGFGNEVGYFYLQKNYTSSLQWLGTQGNKLILDEADITNVIGLSQNNADLFKQRGAIGKPAAITNDGLPTIRDESSMADANNNSKPAFTKPALKVNMPPSLLFTQPKPSTPQAAFRQWAQAAQAQGTWALERDGQNLRIAFDPNTKSKDFNTALTRLCAYLSQLPEWQQVVTHQQEGNALLIRLQSEADARAYEAPLKSVLGIEEFKLSQSCVIS